MEESSPQQVTEDNSSGVSSFQELLESGRFNPEIWNSFSDSGLIMLVCFKFEMLLTELLAQFCNDTHQDVAVYYLREYPAKIRYRFEELQNKLYPYLLTTCCKMTLGNLIHEVFYTIERGEEEDQINYGCVADHYDLGDDEKDIFEEINELRNEVAHFGADTNSTRRGRLRVIGREKQDSRHKRILHSIMLQNHHQWSCDEEGKSKPQDMRKFVLSCYKIIINGRTFQSAYVDNHAEVSIN